MMTTDFALLAPVPVVHLESALKTCAEQGKVAFGSEAGMVFAELSAMAGQEPVDVLIYASGGPPSPPKVTWRGMYIGIAPARAGAHPAGMKFRPQSTAVHAPDNSGSWKVFWEVTNLRKLTSLEQIKISELFGIGKKTRFAANFYPHGPILVRKTFAG